MLEGSDTEKAVLWQAVIFPKGVGIPGITTCAGSLWSVAAQGCPVLAPAVCCRCLHTARKAKTRYRVRFSKDDEI